MNEQLAQHNFSGDSTGVTINSTLVSMQIQALRESLRRLVDSEEDLKMELSENELNDPPSKPIC